MTWSAVILAGGRGSRLGGEDKALLEVRGEPLLSRVLRAVGAADDVVIVGEPRHVPGLPAGVKWTREIPEYGGPVAGLAAGLELVSAEVVALLACDQPHIDASHLERLLAGLGDHDGVVSVTGGRKQPLCAVYRAAALRSALGALPEIPGASMRDLLADLDLGELLDEQGNADDIDTPADLERLRRTPEG